MREWGMQDECKDEGEKDKDEGRRITKAKA
jgi:hypothetical protein